MLLVLSVQKQARNEFSVFLSVSGFCSFFLSHTTSTQIFLLRENSILLKTSRSISCLSPRLSFVLRFIGRFTETTVFHHWNFFKEEITKAIPRSSNVFLDSVEYLDERTYFSMECFSRWRASMLCLPSDVFFSHHSKCKFIFLSHFCLFLLYLSWFTFLFSLDLPLILFLLPSLFLFFSDFLIYSNLFLHSQSSILFCVTFSWIFVAFLNLSVVFQVYSSVFWESGMTVSSWKL